MKVDWTDRPLHLRTFDDPLVRAVVWRSRWDAETRHPWCVRKPADSITGLSSFQRFETWAQAIEWALR